MELTATQGLSQALKEWAVAVDALEQGKTILLLRKGGIREQGGRFTVAQDRVLLYPTYEHQKPNLLKPDYADLVQAVSSGWHPVRVRIGAWAEITHVLQMTEESVVAALLPFHIWNQQFVSDRLGWKPRSPLYGLLLRVYRLAEAQEIDYRPEYGGCRSWIILETMVSVQGGVPVLSDGEYARLVGEVRGIVDR